jgi:hypothetical protein
LFINSYVCDFVVLNRGSGVNFASQYATVDYHYEADARMTLPQSRLEIGELKVFFYSGEVQGGLGVSSTSFSNSMR